MISTRDAQTTAPMGKKDMTKTAPLVFADLDDSFFQTLRKCGKDVDHSTLTPASWMSTGEPSGYMTPMQRVFHRWLSEGEIVPVTARNRLVMERTMFRGTGRAICSHGGLILTPEGEVDRRWREHLLSLDSNAGMRVAEAYALIGTILKTYGDRVRHWMVSEDGLDLYVTVKQNTMADGTSMGDAALHALGAGAMDLLPDDWKLHCNGNNVAFMPPWLGKRQAVEHLIHDMRAADPERPIIGFGDSTSDLPFMGLCDYVMTPSKSQIASLLSEASKAHQ